MDDEYSICRALQIALGRQGHEVITTESGEVALRLLREEHFDCLVLDLRIPDLRGDVLFELAASHQPHLRHQSLFITGDTTAYGHELLDACSCPVISKPFDLAELTATVNRLVRRSRDQTA
ncbi:MAG TPA: response regulator [Gemmatimonadaceae bacterium]|nr:response regulator [Gemmatimonadaceae bacterium]